MMSSCWTSKCRTAAGLDLLPRLKALPGDPEVIIVTGYGTAKAAEFALKNGAWDYLEKKASVEELLLSVNRALHYRKEKQGSKPLAPVKRERIIGNSPNMRPCFALLAQAAASEVNVLITGETGTVKRTVCQGHPHQQPPGRPWNDGRGTTEAKSPRRKKLCGGRLRRPARDPC
jgi:two-component system NtrC family response regulator